MCIMSPSVKVFDSLRKSSRNMAWQKLGSWQFPQLSYRSTVANVEFKNGRIFFLACINASSIVLAFTVASDPVF